MPPPWRLVSPEGILHYVCSLPDLRDLAIHAGIKPFNLEHLVGEKDGNCDDPGHAHLWQLFERMPWIASEPGT